jgi:hypothetical protein
MASALLGPINNQQIFAPCPESRKKNLLLKACRQGRRARTTHSRTQPNAARVASVNRYTGALKELFLLAAENVGDRL